MNSYQIWKKACGTLLVALMIGACASSGSTANSNRTTDSVSENRKTPNCPPGETLMCQTQRTGFGRLSTGRRTNYDHCSCEPDSVVIRDTPLPQY